MGGFSCYVETRVFSQSAPNHISVFTFPVVKQLYNKAALQKLHIKFQKLSLTGFPDIKLGSVDNDGRRIIFVFVLIVV